MKNAKLQDASPNIIFILADDMGYGDFSIFNGGRSNTPTLDYLINESVCLTHQYTASPVCNPSRAALMTGRYPHRTGSIDTLEWWGLERLALRETTIADVFKSAGYTTGHIGKWHLGSFDFRYHPLNRGFDETVCFRGGMHDYYDWRIEYGNTVKRADGRYLTDVWTDEAIKFIKRRKSTDKFYLQVNYNAPHTPLQAPENDILPFLEKGFNRGVSTVYGMIQRMDSGIQQILDVLESQGLADNTILVFTSDNGPQFGNPSHIEADLENTEFSEWQLDRFNCNFNGAKGTIYEGGIRVPLIIRWPDGLEGKRLISLMSHFTDWFPTLLAASGISVPSEIDIDGVNIWPMLSQEIKCNQPQRFWQWNRFSPDVTSNAAVIDGDWKLVRPRIDETMVVPDSENLKISMYNPEHFIEHGIFSKPYPAREIPPPPPAELYNIAKDPEERNNLADSEIERVRKLLVDLESWFEKVEFERSMIFE